MKYIRLQTRGIHNSAPLSAATSARQIDSKTPSNPFLLKLGDFKKKQASRPDFNSSLPVEASKTPKPSWKYGDGVNDKSGQHLQHIEIDPYKGDRDMIANYRLLIAGIPRPISFVSTVSQSGQTNLAPFSYFQVVDHDPPILVIGFSGRKGRPKDTQKNLVETGECVISIVSEHMIEAVNGTSLDVPYGVSEWGLSGFQSAPSITVKPHRVKDAIFSIEGKLLEMKDLSYGHQDTGQPHGALAIIQATRFWVREDALNESGDDIDLAKLRPLVQLGGISYGRVRETFELPRPGLQAEMDDDSRGLKPYLGADIEPQTGLESSGLLHEEDVDPPEAKRAVG
jgi:flavin reductase (DIM6/NTAB) family NADH-FMN oxidoreductase RutF